jgi:hypothetical protein
MNAFTYPTGLPQLPGAARPLRPPAGSSQLKPTVGAASEVLTKVISRALLAHHVQPASSPRTAPRLAGPIEGVFGLAASAERRAERKWSEIPAAIPQIPYPA